MSPPPVRSETNATVLPSGEKRGCDSFAECETSNRASPPASGADHRSPPDANAISERSGAMAGSVKYGFGSDGGAGACCAAGTPANEGTHRHKQAARARRIAEFMREI